MEIKTTISLDMTRKTVPAVINAVQGETCTRVVEALLYSNGAMFNTDGCVVSIAYKKPDGTSGWYDKMPDDAPAYETENNAVVIKLAPQMLTVPGCVQAIIRIDDESGSKRAKTFPFIISVTRDPAIDSIKSENYYKVQNWDEVNAEFESIWSSLGNAVLFTAQDLTDDQKIQAVENLGLTTMQIDLNWNPDGSWESSHTPWEILVGIAQGRNIVCLSAIGTNFLSFDGITSKVTSDGEQFYAHFKSAPDDTGAWTEYIIDPEGAVTVQSRTPVLGTPQTLTPEQQAQARENIGVKDAITVTLDLNSMTANYTAVEMYQHINNGVIILARVAQEGIDGIAYSSICLAGCDGFDAYFIQTWDEDIVRKYTVNAKGKVSFGEIDIGSVITKTDKLSEEIKALETNSKSDYAGAVKDIASGDVISVSDASNAPIQELTLYGKTTQDGTPTPDVPVDLVSVGDGGSVGMTVAGKNLFNDIGWFESNGFTKQSDGSWLGVPINKNCWTNTAKKAGTVYITMIARAENCTHSPAYFIVYYTDGTGGVAIDVKNHTTFTELTFQSDPDKTLDYIKWTYGGDGVYYVKGVMISFIDGEYEPYKKAQTITASTPNGLPGIPVTSGGNYTDASGQQWVCDEIDFARGVRVQRFGEVDMGTLDWYINSTANIFFSSALALAASGNVGICTHFPVVKTHFSYLADNSMNLYDGGFSGLPRCYVKCSAYTNVEALKAAMSGAKVIYELATPVETPLSAEEIAAYKALHSKKPNTTVFNDGGAGLSLEYIADTKIYIDNKFTELQNAILSAGANI